MVLICLLCSPPVAVLAEPTARAEKKPVNTVFDLPRHTYDVSGTAAAFVKDRPATLKLADQLKADLESDLAQYDIKDRSALEAYIRELQMIDMLKGNLAGAEARIPAIRELQTRPEDKLLTGLTTIAHVDAVKAATVGGAFDKTKYHEVFKSELRAEVTPLPMDVIHDKLTQIRSTSKMISPELIEASMNQQLDPLIAANAGHVPGEVASSLVTEAYLLQNGIELAKMTGEVYGEILDKAAAAGSTTTQLPSEKTDLWTPTLVTLDQKSAAKPVVVGVWDTGVDTRLFPGLLWINPTPSTDGKDGDRSGFTNDLHGIAFTMDHRPATGDLYPLEALKSPLETCLGYVAASMQMQAGLETPAVNALREHVLSLRGPDIQNFMQDMGIIGNYAHGTHVAGIIAAGNPFVRLLVIRETFPYKEIPDNAPSIEEYRQWGESAQTAIEFAKAAHARVINMSWRIPRAAVESELAIKGVGKTPAERAELSKQIFNEFKDRLEKAIAGAPDILFVAGAGNEDNDADFSEYIPAGLRLPNLLTVSAVDASGKPTNFTTTGKNIDLYANGYEIDSVVPGGQHMKFSGTSMSSPQVANLAAKLIALKPELTVEQTIALIRKGATPLTGRSGCFVINPAASVKLLEHQTAN